MEYVYKPKGVCSSQIDFEIKDGVLRNVRYTGGCNGNLKAVGALTDGMKVQDVIHRLKGIECGHKGTSCGDQLARALEEAVHA